MSGAGAPAPVRNESGSVGGSVFVSASGLELHVQLLGAGPPVLILHGFTGSGDSMDEVARGLAGDFRTVRVDLVGHGRSGAPRELEPYRMTSCVAQLVDALDALGIESTHLLGYSMGGRAALALCAWHPDRVRSALLVGGSAGLANPEERRERRASDEALAHRIEREGLARFVDDWMALPLFATQRRLGPAALARSREQRLENRAHGLAGSLRGMGTGAQPPLHDHLPGIQVPVLLVAGELDAKFTRIAAALADELPDGRALCVPGAGHACHLEAPEAFREAASTFFSGVEARRTARGRPCSR